MDLYDHSVVASETGKWVTSDLAVMTLEKVFHSHKEKLQKLDIAFRPYCQEQGITQSMSAAGCPYNNAPMERYYNTFKAEFFNGFHFRTDEELEYAYVWYNQIGPHSYNHYQTPYAERYGLKSFRQSCYKNA